MDPCLDDCVMFAKRLKSLKNKVGLDILPGLPHGFLNFVKVCITFRIFCDHFNHMNYFFYSYPKKRTMGTKFV